VKNTQTININNNTIEYYLTTGKSETIVLVNGSGGPILGWFRVIDELSTKYNVLAYNRPGIGKSTKPSTPQTFTQAATDLLELLHCLRISGEIVMVGHSLGGLIAQQFCISFPGSVKFLILLEPSTVWDILENKKLPTDPNEPNSELNYVKEGANEIKDKLFPDIPVIICVGTKKSLLSFFFKKKFIARLNNLKKLSMQIKGSKIIELGNSGHFPQITEPKKVVQVIFSLG
jgi:pimeloyl-ACP methyl ester carboxylesterase